MRLPLLLIMHYATGESKDNGVLPILYRDEDLVAVAKPAGLLVHRTALDPHESEFALQKVRDQVGSPVYPVHRLDRPTSGVLIFALRKEVATILTCAFGERRVGKTYLAVVRGFAPPTARIDHPLKEEKDPLADPQARRDAPPQAAITDVECLATCELPVTVDRYPTTRYSLVRARPVTGRKHQIRRHLRHLGHPVIGDVTHGSGKHNMFFRERLQCRRLLLACTQMTFSHPREPGREIVIHAPLAADFAIVLERLGWDEHVV